MQESVLSFYHVHPEDSTEGIRLDSVCDVCICVYTCICVSVNVYVGKFKVNLRCHSSGTTDFTFKTGSH